MASNDILVLSLGAIPGENLDFQTIDIANRPITFHNPTRSYPQFVMQYCHIATKETACSVFGVWRLKLSRLITKGNWDCMQRINGMLALSPCRLRKTIDGQ